MTEVEVTYRDPSENDFPRDYDQTKIDSRVKLRSDAIRTKMYGKSVRGALAQGIEIASVVATESKEQSADAEKTSKDLNNRWNDQIKGKVDPDEVVDARRPEGGNAYPTLNERIQAGVDERSKNVKAFGVRGDGSTNDLAAINQVIADAEPGETLFFPAGNYKISDNIVINKKINLAGVKPVYQSGDLVRGSVVRGGGGIFFTTGSAGSSATGIGVVVATGFTNGFDLHGVISAVEITDCLTIAQSHGFLVESYDGLVDGTVIRNCEAHDSIHGFISKATRTTIDNCLASGISSWGYGVISDNIPGADKIGAALDNKVINCRAVKAGVGFAQYRRNYFADEPASVPCNNNQFIGCSNTNCTYGLSVGDAVGDTGGGKYTTYPVTNTTITSYTEGGGKVRAQYSENLVINGIQLQSIGEADQDHFHSNLKMTALGVSGERLGRYADVHLLEKSTTPSVGFGRTFRSDNTTYTEITDLKNAVLGATYTIILWDDYTIIDRSDTIHLLGAVVQGYGSSVTLRCQDGNFFELYRSAVIDHGAQMPASTADINLGAHRFIDVVQNARIKAVPVHIKDPELHDADLTILVRSTNGTITPAGFDADQFVVPSDLPLGDLPFGTGLLTHWKYLISIKKYILVSYRLAKYA